MKPGKWLKDAHANGLIAGPDYGDLAPVFAAVRAAGFCDPIPEAPVRQDRKWRFDWAWASYMVALEREGGKFTRVGCKCGRSRMVFVSRHHSRDGLEADLEKYNCAAVLGWKVIRCTPPMIRDGRAVAILLEALKCSSK